MPTRFGKRIRPRLAVTVLLVIALAAACSSSNTTSSSSTPTVAGSRDAACEQGAKEGTLNYAASTDAAVFAQEIQPFNQRYPSIKVNYVSARPEDQVQRIVAETQARQAPELDAIAGTGVSYFPLFTRALVMDVDWAALGVPSDLVFTLQGVRTFRSYRMVVGLAYNSKLVKPEELPADWDGLVNPKWAGKVVMDPRGQDLVQLALVWGEQRTLDWLDRMMETDKPLIVKGATAGLQKVIAGEALLSTSAHDGEIGEQTAKGAPVAIKYLDVVPTQDNQALILKGAQHPNAAACFLAWWGSPEGQAQQLKYEYKSNETTPKELQAGSRLAAITTPNQAAELNKVLQEFSRRLAE